MARFTSRRSRYSRSGSRYGFVGRKPAKRRRTNTRRASPGVMKLVIEHVSPSAVMRPDLANVKVERPTKRAKL